MAINTPVRIYAVAGIMVATFGIAKYIQLDILAQPEVKFPNWTFKDMPFQLGDWHGEQTESDPKLTGRTGAKVTVERNYQDDIGHRVAVYTAMFDDVPAGVYHSPMNCYWAQGFRTKVEERKIDLKISDQLSIPVSLTTWEKDNQQVTVIYWYQLGEHILYDRLGLGMKVRRSLAGRPYWPPLIKVMMQIAAPDEEEAERVITDLAERVAKWENSPEHRKDWMAPAEQAPSGTSTAAR